MSPSAHFFDRHLLGVSVAIFLALFAPLLFQEWLSLRAEALHDVRSHATALSELLGRNLGEFGESLDEVIVRPGTPAFTHLDLRLRDAVGHLGFSRVRVYDREGRVVYATDGDMHPEVLSEGFRAALGGESHLEVLDAAAYLDRHMVAAAGPVAEVFFPVGIGASGEPRLVLETYADYAPFQQRSTNQLIRKAVSLAITEAVALGLLCFAYRRKHHYQAKAEALERILPICMHCKKIRSETAGTPGQWLQLEAYFKDADDIDFTHGICPSCRAEHYPDRPRKP